MVGTLCTTVCYLSFKTDGSALNIDAGFKPVSLRSNHHAIKIKSKLINVARTPDEEAKFYSNKHGFFSSLLIFVFPSNAATETQSSCSIF